MMYLGSKLSGYKLSSPFDESNRSKNFVTAAVLQLHKFLLDFFPVHADTDILHCHHSNASSQNDACCKKCWLNWSSGS